MKGLAESAIKAAVRRVAYCVAIVRQKPCGRYKLTDAREWFAAVSLETNCSGLRAMRISYRETAWIADNLARLLEAGIPLERVFEKVHKYCRSGRAREAVAALRDAVVGGRTFYEGLAARSKAWRRRNRPTTR